MAAADYRLRAPVRRFVGRDVFDAAPIARDRAALLALAPRRAA